MVIGRLKVAVFDSIVPPLSTKPPELLPKAPFDEATTLALARKVPSVAVVVPLYVLVPDSARIPVPTFVMPAVPVLLLMTPVMVRSLEVAPLPTVKVRVVPLRFNGAAIDAPTAPLPFTL